MEGEAYHPIAVQQCKLLCFCFLFFLSTQRGYSYDPYNVVKDVFSWFAFENSLDKDLFYNVHRMDKTSFCKLLEYVSPQLGKKYKDPKKLRLSHACQLSITLSYLGGARICDLRVLCRPIKKKVIFSYIWNVIDSVNETFQFSFPMDHQSLMNIEAGFRSKSRLQVLKGCLGCIDGIHFPMENLGR